MQAEPSVRLSSWEVARAAANVNGRPAVEFTLPGRKEGTCHWALPERDWELHDEKQKNGHQPCTSQTQALGPPITQGGWEGKSKDSFKHTQRV